MNRQPHAGGAARWKAAMLRLEDGAFFELMRGALGGITTPFNKHRLIERLAAFLRSPAVRERAAALLDREDVRLLSAVALLDHPDEERLAAFFERELPFLELHCRLLNLEERLLIYRDSSDPGESKPLRLNPFLAETLRTRAVRFETLFPSRAVGTIEGAPRWLDDRALVSAFAFLAHSGEILKAGGGLRKRAETELSRAFPGLTAETFSGTRFSLLFGALRAAGLVTIDGAAVTPDRAVWERFAVLAPAERLEIVLAAGTLGAEDGNAGRQDGTDGPAPEHAGRFSFRASGRRRGSPCPAEGEEWPFGIRGAISRRRRTIRVLCTMLEPERAYGERTLERMTALAWAPGEPSGAAEAGRMIRILEEFGLFVRAGAEELALTPHMAAGGGSGHGSAGEPGGNEPEAVVQPNFTVTLKPFVSLEAGLAAAVCARLRRADIYSELEITREAAGFAFRAGLTKSRIVTGLERLSGAPLPQNIAFSLETWEAEFRSVSLYRGLVLRVDEERRYLVEHSQKLAPLILKTLAPGLYLVRDEYERLARALSDSGIRMIPEVAEPREPEPADIDTDRTEPFAAAEPMLPAPDRRTGNGPERRPSPAEPDDRPEPGRDGAGTGAEEPGGARLQEGEPAETHGEPEAFPTPTAAEIQAGLFETLDRAEFPPEIRDALAERIRSKLVLVPEQLDPQTVSRHKTEAKGLDYLGKVRLIEQAIRSGADFLELNARSADGTPEKLVVKPDALERHGGELVLEGVVLPGRRPVSVAVSRLGYVRKFRGSFYTG